jgi:hypothetical protein
VGSGIARAVRSCGHQTRLEGSGGRRFIASQGGDVSIGGRLPHLFQDAGLSVEHTGVTFKTGRPGSAVWRWLTTYFMGMMDRHARLAPFFHAQARRLRRHWIRATGRHTSLIIAPAVLDGVGRARG